MDFKGVLMLSDSFFPVVGGREVVIDSLMREYCGMGVYSVLGTTTFGKYPTFDDASLPYKVIRSKGFSLTKNEVLARLNRKFKRQIEDEIISGRVDVIHVQTKFKMCKYALKLKKKYGIKVVASCHTDYRNVYRKTIKIPVISKVLIGRIKRLMNKVDRVVTVSNYMKNELEQMGVKREIIVIPNGNRMANFTPKSDKIIDVNKRYGWSEDDNILVFVGRVTADKSIDVVLESFAKTKTASKLAVIGSGDINSIRDKARRLNIDKRCQFLGEITNVDELSAIISRASIQVFPSKLESFGMTVRECGALSTPSIVTKGIATAEPIKDGFNGFISDGTPEDIARIIDEVLSDKIVLANIGENAKRTMSTSWREVAEKVVDVYKQNC